MVKRLTYATTTLLLDDATADTVIDYAAALSTTGLSHPVHLEGLTSSGAISKVTLLLHGHVSLTAEDTAAVDTEVPSNTDARDWMRSEINRIRYRPMARAETREEIGAAEFTLLD